ncbi:hypothetical protein KFL_005190030 [Klebsormidium nitens]|uniref:Uncharacterized protein n=1 Tax=Klebsormidium nitens TaxID=105231 RepID=A0A1Y1IJU7_KLENI|nr:hypothetical protein KFL_005190030 [Klebsormidium nitens]|eukprot:GAQ89411.1 hypothetical protein KFL_005190030 [Klebsormidium nitens]
MCFSSDEEDDDDRSDVTVNLLAARKKRALYATKLLIETPLLGVCALTLLTAWAHWAPDARASGAPLDVYALTNNLFIKGDIELLDLYAITPAWAGVYMPFRRCTDDVSELVSAVQECCELRKALP